MSAHGRKLPLISVVLSVPERSLSGKADVQILDFEKSLRNDRYARGSGHWDGRVLNYRYRPQADIGDHPLNCVNSNSCNLLLHLLYPKAAP
jgi:hypothetical protein